MAERIVENILFCEFMSHASFLIIWFGTVNRPLSVYMKILIRPVDYILLFFSASYMFMLWTEPLIAHAVLRK